MSFLYYSNPDSGTGKTRRNIFYIYINNIVNSLPLQSTPGLYKNPTISNIRFLNEATSFLHSNYYRILSNTDKEIGSTNGPEVNFFTSTVVDGVDVVSPSSAKKNWSTPDSGFDALISAPQPDGVLNWMFGSGIRDHFFQKITTKTEYKVLNTATSSKFLILTSMETKKITPPATTDTPITDIYHYQDLNTHIKNYSIGGGYQSNDFLALAPTVLNQSSEDTEQYIYQILGSSGNTYKRILRIVWTGKPIYIESDYNCYFQDVIIDVLTYDKTRVAIHNFINTSSNKDYINIPITIIIKTTDDYKYNNNSSSSFENWQKYGRFGIYYQTSTGVASSHWDTGDTYPTAPVSGDNAQFIHGNWTMDNLIDWTNAAPLTSERKKTLNYILQIRFPGGYGSSPELSVIKLSEITNDDTIPNDVDTTAFNSI